MTFLSYFILGLSKVLNSVIKKCRSVFKIKKLMMVARIQNVALGAAILALAALPSAFHFTPTSQPAVMRHAIDDEKNRGDVKKVSQ